MCSRNTTWLWLALHVILRLALPLHAQSEFQPQSRPTASNHEYPPDRHARNDEEPVEDANDLAISPNGISETLVVPYAELTGTFNARYPAARHCAAASNWSCAQSAFGDDWSSSRQQSSASAESKSGVTDPGSRRNADSSTHSAAVVPSNHPRNIGNDTYYRNKLEFSFDGGWLPINIPFVFDVFMGDAYTRAPLDYTLVPLIASLRWHIDDVGGPWIFRGNWDMTFSGSVTLIPRGPETRYFSYDMGIRRNFVPHRGKIAPYFDGRLGMGQIDAKEPLGVQFAQGQNFTFTVNMGSGVRYNFSPRYSLSAGLNWMHISNLYLSEPAFSNYGINVYGPMFGIDVRLSRSRHASK